MNSNYQYDEKLIEFKDLPKNTKTPILTYCRQLLKKGWRPDAKLLVYREKQPEPDVIVNNIGDASKLNVLENEREGPRFVKFKNWHPPSSLKKKKKLEGDV